MKYSWLVSLFLLSSLTLLANEPARVCVTEFNEDGPKNPDLNWVGPSMKEAIEVALEEKFIFQKVDCNLNEDSLSNGGLSLKTKNLDLLLTGSYSSIHGRKLKLSARIYNRYQKNSKELPSIQKKIDNRIFTVTDQISNEIIVTLQDMAAQSETRPESEQDKPEKQTLVLKREDNNAEAESLFLKSSRSLSIWANLGAGSTTLHWENPKSLEYTMMTTAVGLNYEHFGYFIQGFIETSKVDRPSGSPQITSINFDGIAATANGGGGNSRFAAVDFGYYFYLDWVRGARIGIGISNQWFKDAVYEDLSFSLHQVGLYFGFKQFFKAWSYPAFISLIFRTPGLGGSALTVTQGTTENTFCIDDSSCAFNATVEDLAYLELNLGFYENRLDLLFSLALRVKDGRYSLNSPFNNVNGTGTTYSSTRIQVEKKLSL
jgi:hypothetical protein